MALLIQARRLVAGVAVLFALVLLAVGMLAMHAQSGYFSPVFAPDGQSVFVVRRDVRAAVLGLGYEFWTPPATVWVLRDRFALVNIGLKDGRITVVKNFGASPLEGRRMQAYHGAIYGEVHAHLRWADAAHLDYEIGVTRADTPLSRTFVVRQVWNPATRTLAATTPWQETSTGMAGDEAAQLSGDLEVIAVPGNELMPCAVVVLRTTSDARPLVQTARCRAKYPSGFSQAVLAPFSRRADIERSETIERTYADLVARGRDAGLSEGDAMLKANKQMERLGFFPKSPTIVAHRVPCGEGTPLFRITDMEFRVGLFQDIANAIEHPDEEVDKESGNYIIHRDFDTSRQLNAFLENRNATTFYVEGHGGCWRMSINRP